MISKKQVEEAKEILSEYEKQKEGKPEVLKNPNFARVIASVEEYMNKVQEGGYVDEDLKQFWEWINEKS